MPLGRGLLQKSVWLIGVCVLLGSVWGLAEAYEAVEVKEGGKVTGVVKFVGTPPPPEPLEVTRDKEKCGVEEHLSEALVVSDKGGIRNAVVSLEGIEKGKSQPEMKTNPQYVQEKCWFAPHVLLVPAGSTVDLYNKDKAMHNIHTVSKINPIINKAHPSFKKRLRFKLKKPEVVQVKCDMHSWMNGWFIVTDHPYYAVTDVDSAFALTDVPPGTYTLKAWHETLGTQTQEIVIGAKGEATVEFEMKQ